MAESVRLWERVQPGDQLLRFTTHPGEVQLAVVRADGQVEINWPEIEKEARGLRPDEGRLATAWALARLLMAARNTWP